MREHLSLIAAEKDLSQRNKKIKCGTELNEDFYVGLEGFFQPPPWEGLQQKLLQNVEHFTNPWGKIRVKKIVYHSCPPRGAFEAK